MKKQTSLIRVGLIFCLTVGMLAKVQPASAANLSVCQFGGCSYSSITAAVNAATNGDTITIGYGNYHEHDITIGKNITINGTGSSLVTINGDDTSRIFNINTGVTVSISGMTVTHGHVNSGGGGIYNAGSLTLNNVIVTNNYAYYRGGGIYSDGTLTMTDSQVTQNSTVQSAAGFYLYLGSTTNLTNVLIQGNTITGPGGSGVGGGIFLVSNSGGSASNLTLTRVSVDNNTAPVDGGGIYADGYSTVTITYSTISNNHAAGAAGLHIFGSSTLLMGNDTVAGNDAGTGTGGGLVIGGTASLRSVTVAGNHAGAGGGIANNGGVVHLGASILAGNTASSVDPDCSGTLDTSYDLIGNATSPGCTIGGTTPHNITGVSANLGVLADNGGQTKTMALLPGSPAIDAGDNSVCMGLDQRGVSRPQPAGGTCDMGAYEAIRFLIYLPLVVR